MKPLLLLLLAASASHAAPPMKGMAIGLYGEGRDDYGKAMRELVALGVDHVSLVVSWRQKDVRSNVLEPTPGVTVPDDRVREVIRLAKQHKLQVFLFPIIEVEVRRPLEWRGVIKPGDVDVWWKAYQRFILHYAQMAQKEGVELFAIGSELVSTEKWQDRWYALISAVKREFKGKLLYSANWDHYEPVTFWNRVDFVGVTAYNELTKSADASQAELTKSWQEVRRKLVEFSKKVNRPLVITEIGYVSQDGAAVHPWDYTLRAPLDLEEQRRCYAAFVNAWKDEKALHGVYWWNWYGEGGAKDTTYTPRGKPAEKVVRAWYLGKP